MNKYLKNDCIYVINNKAFKKSIFYKLLGNVYDVGFYKMIYYSNGKEIHVIEPQLYYNNKYDCNKILLSNNAHYQPSVMGDVNKLIFKGIDVYRLSYNIMSFYSRDKLEVGNIDYNMHKYMIELNTVDLIFNIISYIDKNNILYEDAIATVLYFTNQQIKEISNTQYIICSGDKDFDLFFAKHIDLNFMNYEYLDDSLHILDDDLNIVESIIQSITINTNELLSLDKKILTGYDTYIIKGDNDFIIEFIVNGIKRFNDASISYKKPTDIYNNYVSFFSIYSKEEIDKINNVFDTNLEFIDFNHFVSCFEKLRIKHDKVDCNTDLYFDNLPLYYERIDDKTYYNNLNHLLLELNEGKNVVDIANIFNSTYNFWKNKSQNDILILIKYLHILKDKLPNHIDVINAIIEVVYNSLKNIADDDNLLLMMSLKDHYILDDDKINLFDNLIPIRSFFNLIDGQVDISTKHDSLVENRNNFYEYIVNNKKYVEPELISEKLYTTTYILFTISRTFVNKMNWRNNNIFIEYMIKFAEEEINNLIKHKYIYNSFVFHKFISLVSAKNNLVFKYFKENYSLESLKLVVSKYKSELKFISDNNYHNIGFSTFSKFLDELAKLALFTKIIGEKENIIDEYNKQISLYIQHISITFNIYRNNPIFNMEKKELDELNLFYAELAWGFMTYSQTIKHGNYDMKFNTYNKSIYNRWRMFNNKYIQSTKKIYDNFEFNTDEELTFIY